ncbi:MAG: hypothetical protein IE916_10605 [Epsilonproteobacteria bacterium]|nr:hypothetical protein [Campylobacterota bacterium]MBD3830301.1 hypothetical protein [Arcobacter sp.]
MQQKFTIYIDQPTIKDDRIQEGNHYLVFGEKKIQIESTNFSLLQDNDPSSIEFYFELINARSKYMSEIIIFFQDKQKELFDKYNIDKYIDSFGKEEIFKFFIVKERVLNSMIDICELSYNMANKNIYQKYIDDNMPKITYNTEDDE